MRTSEVSTAPLSMSNGMFKERFLVLVYIATTCDEHQVCVSQDAAEMIELAWIVLDTTDLTEVARSSVLIRPTNTTITDICSE